MANIFNSIPLPKVKKSKFNLSYINRFTCDMGIIYPVMSKEVLPGDVYKILPETFIRTAPLVTPAFVNLKADIRFFFVPNRLIYKNWEKFIVRGDDGKTDFIKPYFQRFIGKDIELDGGNSSADTLTPGSLLDYLDFPYNNNIANAANGSIKVDALKVNAYNKIYNDWYRDENLQPEVFLFDDDGEATNLNNYYEYWNNQIDNTIYSEADVFPLVLRYSSFRHDYFTSALPFLQRGEEISVIANQVSLPYATPVYGSPGDGSLTGNLLQWQGGSGLTGEHLFYLDNDGLTPKNTLSLYLNSTDLQTTAITINELRTAIAIQEFQELDARAGTSRYIEFLLANFNVRSRDARLQRSEYLGGNSFVIQISDIPQTSSTNDVTAQGNLAGKGIAYSADKQIKYHVPEHGYIFAMFRIIPDVNYYQGLKREWTRYDAFDYYVPSFDHLSEQAIKSKELYYIPGGSNNDDDFGYIPRFAEYRSYQNEVHGIFRSPVVQGTYYNQWTLNRNFDAEVAIPPKLNSNFISVTAYSKHLYSMFAYVGSQSMNYGSHHFYCMINYNIRAIRPLSKYGVPKF